MALGLASPPVGPHNFLEVFCPSHLSASWIRGSKRKVGHGLAHWEQYLRIEEQMNNSNNS